MGDTYLHDNMVIKAEGVTIDSNIDRAVNQWSDVTFPITVNDGTLNLEFANGGGRDGNWIVNGITVTP